MRRFTIRDFIGYNNPCFSCGDQISFNIMAQREEVDLPSALPVVVMPDRIQVNLLITYKRTLILEIFHKTNKLDTNNKQYLADYLKTHKLSLLSYCRRCGSRMETQNLIFDLDKGRVEAVSLKEETLIVVSSNGANMYSIFSTFSDQQSRLTVYSLDKVKPKSPLLLKLPLLPKYRFKNKRHFLDKMKTIVVFG